jgi:hypothetical protein
VKTSRAADSNNARRSSRGKRALLDVSTLLIGLIVRQNYQS